MDRRVRKRLRDEAFDAARRWLGRKRLPAGVPAQIKRYVNGLDGWPEPEDDTLWHIIRPHRKAPWLP